MLSVLALEISTQQATLTEQKLEDVKAVVLELLEASCTECASENIERQSFSCFEESSSFVTYRVRLEGTSETDSDSLISLIEDWVRGGGASTIVTGILMTVDPNCSVAISSLSEPECSPAQPVTPSAPSLTPQDTSRIMVSSAESCVCSDNTPAIIGGVVAIVIVVTTAGTIIAVVALVLKSRPQSIKKTSTEVQRTAISTTTNTAYEMMKRGQEGMGGAPTVPQSSETGSVEEEKMYEMIPGENK